jgi:hypothetical protein
MCRRASPRPDTRATAAPAAPSSEAAPTCTAPGCHPAATAAPTLAPPPAPACAVEPQAAPRADIRNDDGGTAFQQCRINGQG